jgi:hypothetical protein
MLGLQVSPPEKVMLDDFFTGIAANIATAILFAMVFAIVSTIVAWTAIRKRRRMLACFGVVPTRPTIAIYVSRIEVKGSVNTLGVLDVLEGFHGACLSKPEYDAALELRQQFLFRWFPFIPRGVLQWIIAQNFSVAEIDPRIDTSPPSSLPDSEVESYLRGNVVLIGSGIYNKLSAFVDKRSDALLAFERTSVTEQSVVHLPSRQVFDGRSKGKETAIVQRLVTPHGVITCCAGAGAGATTGAVRYVIRNWEKHDRHAGGKSFAIVLTWTQFGNVDAPTNREPDEVVVCEAPGSVSPIPVRQL